MVPGSRRFLSLLSEVQIDAVSQVKGAKKTAHDTVGVKVNRQWPIGNAKCKETAPSQHKRPPEHLHPPGHEKPRRVQGATVKNHPNRWQAGDLTFCSLDLSRGACLEQEDGAQNKTCRQRGKQSLSNPTGRRRPKGLAFSEGLAAHEQKGAYQGR